MPKSPGGDVLGGKKFDCVHWRMLCLGMHGWNAYFGNRFEYLQEGGWVEVQEVKVTFYSDSSPPPSQRAPFLRFGHLITESMRKAGFDGRASSKFKSMLKKTGFVDVKENVTR